MARLFDDGSSEYLEIDTAAITDVPMTISLWFRTNDVTLNQYGVTLADKDVEDQRFGIGAGGDIANDPLFFYARNGVDSIVIPTTNFMTVNTWHHGLVVGEISGTDASYKVILDGDTGNAGDSGSEVARPVGFDRTSIGRMGDSTPSDYFSGDLGEVAIWNINMSYAEVVELATGAVAWKVRPQNLVFYASLIRGLNDIKGGLVLTAFSGNSGPIVSPHPRIIEEGSTRGVWAIPAVEGVAPTGVLYGPLVGPLGGPI